MILPKREGRCKTLRKRLKFYIGSMAVIWWGLCISLTLISQKNKNYYEEQIQTLRGEYEQVKLHLFYGRQLFEYIGIADFWDKMLSWLKRWKEDLPEIPETNFDANPHESFREIKDINARVWQKIISNDKLWGEGIIKTLFRTGDTIKLIHEEFSKMEGKVYRHLADDLKERLVKYYGS
jgi:hypothetical protein